MTCYSHSLNLGASFNRSLFIRASCPTHVSYFRMYLLFTIICIDMTYVLAKLGCLTPVLTPTFPIVRLGGKGRTSAIVTARSARCVPQTGWSRKLAFLREYLVGDLKDDFLPIYLPAPRCFPALFAVRTCTLGHAAQGKEPLTELFSLEDVSY